MILKVRKDFMVFEQRDFISRWFTAVDFHTLEAIYVIHRLGGPDRPRPVNIYFFPTEI